MFDSVNLEASDFDLPYLVIMRIKHGSWVYVTSSLRSTQPTRIPDSVATLPVGVRISYSKLAGVFQEGYPTNTFPSELRAPFYRVFENSGPEDELLYCIIGVSWSPFSSDPETVADQLAIQVNAQLARARILIHRGTAEFSATYYDDRLGDLLADVVPLCFATAASLWLFNGKTKTYTLVATQQIPSEAYDRDWFDCQQQTTLTEFHNSDSHIREFTPDPSNSLNPRVANSFDNGHLCRIVSPFSNRTLAVLVLYGAQLTPVLPLDTQLTLISECLAQHLAALRARRRRVGITIAQTLFEQSPSLQASLHSLCGQLTTLLHFDACSVFLKPSATSIFAELQATADVDGSRVPDPPPLYYVGEGMTGKVLAADGIRAVYDLSEFHDENTHKYDESVSRDRRNWLAVPIRSPLHQEVIGVLRVINKHDGDQNTPRAAHFQGSDIDTVSYLASIIGYIWSNSVLQEEATKHLDSAKRERDAKDQFLMSLTHEMNAPLQPLHNILQHISSRVRTILPNEKRLHYFLETALCECGSMELMLGSVSSLSQPRSVSSPERLHVVRDIVHPIKNLYTEQARVNKGVLIYFEQRMSELPFVFADPVLAKQVLFALVNNALKYCEDKSTINIDGRLTADHRFVEVTIANTGFEIPEGWERRVFERGTRAPNVEEELIPGSGLGLAIARSLTTSMDGDILVRQRVNPVVIAFQLPIAHGDA